MTGDVTILEKYWAGILERLQAEVMTFNQLIAHNAEKGRENELALARILERLVPQKYGIGTGLLIDRNGSYSKQIDVIVFDNSEEPTLLAQTNQLLFPVENVRLCIEVKTNIDSKAIQDAYAKRDSVNVLDSSRGHPGFALVGYNSSVTHELVAERLRQGTPAIDLCYVMELAMVAEATQTGPEGALRISVAPVHAEPRNLGSYVEVADDHVGARYTIGHRLYPIVTLEERAIAVDPARALLLFCERMLGLIAGASTDAGIMSSYLTDLTRDVIEV